MALLFLKRIRVQIILPTIIVTIELSRKKKIEREEKEKPYCCTNINENEITNL
jgi:hypothetical protein